MEGKNILLEKHETDFITAGKTFAGNWTFSGFHPEGCEAVPECYHKTIGFIFEKEVELQQLDPYALIYRTFAKDEGPGCSDEKKELHSAGLTWFAPTDKMAWNMGNDEDFELDELQGDFDDTNQYWQLFKGSKGFSGELYIEE